MGVWQGVAMDSLKFHPGPACPILLNPDGSDPLKRPYGLFRGGPPAGLAASGHFLPPWTPHTVCYGENAMILKYSLSWKRYINSVTVFWVTI
jgi:hypothetical protein